MILRAVRPIKVHTSIEQIFDWPSVVKLLPMLYYIAVVVSTICIENCFFVDTNTQWNGVYILLVAKSR